MKKYIIRVKDSNGLVCYLGKYLSMTELKKDAQVFTNYEFTRNIAENNNKLYLGKWEFKVIVRNY